MAQVINLISLISLKVNGSVVDAKGCIEVSPTGFSTHKGSAHFTFAIEPNTRVGHVNVFNYCGICTKYSMIIWLN